MTDRDARTPVVAIDIDGVLRIAAHPGALERQPDVFTAELTAAVQEASPWAEIIGLCYTAASIGRVLGWDAETVAAATADLRLLALRTVDGHVLYPALQVHDGAVVPGLQTVLAVLRTGIEDPWTWAQWLTAPPPRDLFQDVADPAHPPHVPGPSHLAALIAGQVGDVVRDARHDAAAWRV